MPDYIKELVSLGLITDEKKFRNFLTEKGLVIDVEYVEAIGYKGRVEMVDVGSTLGVCHGCDRYFTCDYDCDECGRSMCYNCAIDGPQNECNRSNVNSSDETESNDDDNDNVTIKKIKIDTIKEIE